MLARLEVRQRCLIVRSNGRQVPEPVQPHLAGGLFGLVLAEGVIGHEGRQPLGPVAAGPFGIHAIAPPVVQDLMSEGGGTNEWQAQDVASEVGQAGHAKAVRQRAGDHAEIAERIVADEAAVALDVAGAVLQVAAGQASKLGMKPGPDRDRFAAFQCHGLVRHLVRSGHDPDAFSGVHKLVLGDGARAGLAHALLAARREPLLACRQRQLERVGEGHARVGIPARARRQVTTFGRGIQRSLDQRVALIAFGQGRQGT